MRTAPRSGDAERHVGVLGVGDDEVVGGVAAREDGVELAVEAARHGSLPFEQFLGECGGGDERGDVARADGGAHRGRPLAAVRDADDVRHGGELCGADPDHPTGVRHRERVARRVQERAGEVGEHARAVQCRAFGVGEHVVQVGADGPPGADADHGAGEVGEAAERRGGLRLAADDLGADRVGHEHRRVERVAAPAAAAGEAVDGVDQAGGDVRAGQAPGQLDDGARRDPREPLGGGEHGPRPAQPQHVGRGEHLGEEPGGDVGEVAARGGVLLVRGVDDERAREAEPLAEQHAELGVDGARAWRS